MKKLLVYALTLFLSISLLGCLNGQDNKPEKTGQSPEEAQQTAESEEAAVKNLVKDFGKKLQAVSLQGPNDVVEKSMQDNYGNFVSAELLASWQRDPLNAPGRMVSSPWPDHIEILTTEKSAESTYKITGEIIEITSAEKGDGGVAAKRPITIVVRKIAENWLIDSVALGSYEEDGAVVYQNTQYGFNFPLPESWQGYEIITAKWEGRALEGPQNGELVETGPLISIRHPQWTPENQRQDIPIMVFTLPQWDLVRQEKISLGAAPIGPKELGRNSQFVFALPARYNFAFPAGFEEVEDILAGNPLQPHEEINAAK
ncbi:MAG: hypothetical protein ACOWWO_08715 [Peptococcaceae bacterium]